VSGASEQVSIYPDVMKIIGRYNLPESKTRMAMRSTKQLGSGSVF
jgi:hypothetical protein